MIFEWQLYERQVKYGILKKQKQKTENDAVTGIFCFLFCIWFGSPRYRISVDYNITRSILYYAVLHFVKSKIRSNPSFIPFRANPTKWSNTLKQFVGDAWSFCGIGT